MIKFIVFDLDGVLVSTKEMHHISLNKSISEINEKYIITLNEHHDRYDGLPTRKKLNMLTKEKGLPDSFHDKIYELKQKYTFDYIKNEIKYDERLVNVLRKLKEDGYIIYVASNAIRETVKLLLYKTGLMEYVDHFISNEDVKKPKPSPEIYLRCMVHSGFSPNETLIVEDSPRGIDSALNSKANIMVVNDPSMVTYENIIKEMNGKKEITKKMRINNLNVLIPMAGRGSRFEQFYTYPKPLIDIYGKPMIQMVVESLGIEANYIYIVREEHYQKYNLKTLLNLITPGCKIIQLDHVTEGAAVTTLMSKEYINNEDMLIIANSDQYIRWDFMNFYYKMKETKADGGILTFHSTHFKWSFVRLDDNENVIEVREKDPISTHATCGIYMYKKGSDYVKYTEQMIKKDIRVNGEFYVAPVYNEFIEDNKKIIKYDVEEMWGLGDPESLDTFLKNHDKIFNKF
jgi:HAD superfamily hydrolase (TIGR01509 family)